MRTLAVSFQALRQKKWGHTIRGLFARPCEVMKLLSKLFQYWPGNKYRRFRTGSKQLTLLELVSGDTNPSCQFSTVGLTPIGLRRWLAQEDASGKKFEKEEANQNRDNTNCRKTSQIIKISCSQGWVTSKRSLFQSTEYSIIHRN